MQLRDNGKQNVTSVHKGGGGMLKIYLLVVTEEYESYTPFKMLFISFSLGALRTCNFTHSHISPPNSSFPLGSAGVILVYGLC